MARRFVLKRDTQAPQPRLTIDYAGELNAQQYAAATAPGGPFLVIAGAGTGKTRTLVYRVAYLVETGISPEHIVLLTFTRRAAREMITRASALLDGRCQQVRGGTFHAFCLNLLRRHAPKLGFENHFTILDAADAADVIDVLRTARGLHKAKKRFPRKKTLYSMFSASTNRERPLAEILEVRYPQFAEYLDDLLALKQDYQGYKQRHSLMDYDDLLAGTLRLFTQHDDVRQQVGALCRYVLVDEYQDTNQLQADLVKQFASVHNNVMAVGDDAQSIYRFRGADFRNIFTFPDRFPGTTVLKLEHNYRSTQPILDFANHILQHANRKYDKRLYTEEKTSGDLPAFVPAPDNRFESRFVTQVILQLREQGVPLHRSAVLFRSGFNSYDLEVELNRRNIPFVKYGGLKLSEAAHIKDVLSHLKVVENPKDAAAWNRILQLLQGIGPRTAHDLIEWITAATGDPFTLEDRPYSPRYIEMLKRLFETLRAVREPEVSLVAQVEALVQYFEPICKQKYYEDYPKRLQDLEHFVALADSFHSRVDFLSSLALDPIELSALDGEPLDDDELPLVLSTIHSAKGLEFHTVFVIHVLDGVLPSGYSFKDDDALDEELRLLYVAITRAEENLFISYPMVQYRQYQGDYFTKPSRFLKGVPEALLEPWQLIEDTAPALPEAPPPTNAVSEAHSPSKPPDEGAGATPVDSDDGLPF